MSRLAIAAVAAAITTVTVTAVTATPAAAQEARAPFTGPRVEATLGYDALRSAGLPNRRDTVDGLRLGGAVGYDLALAPRVTIGAEAGIGFDVAGTSRHTIVGTAGTDTFRLSNGRDLDASLRLGFVAAPRTLLYAKAGWANSEARVRLDHTGGGKTVTSRAHDDQDGVRFGGGVEQALGARAYAKAEYRYTAYGDGVDRHQALVGVGTRF